MAQCAICGSEIPEGANNCPMCGSAIEATPMEAHCTREEWVEGTTSTAGIEVGFSPKFDTPEFQAAMKEGNRRNTKLLVAFAILFPLIGSIVCAIFAGPIGFAMGLILMYLIVIPIVAYFLIKRNTGKTWDGEVIDLVHIRNRESADTYRVVCLTDQGKKVKVNDDSRQMYFYFQIGDRVRFHPRLNIPLEKYDKTHDTYLICPFCRKRQPIDVDKCTNCGKLLLK